MAKDDDNLILLVVAAFVCCLIILAIVSSVVYVFASKEEKKKEEEPTPATTPVTRAAAPEAPEAPPAEPAPGCPTVPYTYCSADRISKVYIVSGCGPSNQLVNKLTREGKISGESDPKVVNCSQNRDVCTAAGILSYPSVICENTPTNIYQGYCE